MNVRTPFSTLLSALLVLMPLNSLAAQTDYDWGTNPDIAFDNVKVELNWDGTIEDIYLIVGDDQDYRTDVLDGMTFRFDLASSFGDFSPTSHRCDPAGSQELVPGDFLKVVCQGRDSTYGSLPIDIDLESLFWDGGEKFRILVTVTNKFEEDVAMSLEVAQTYGGNSDNSKYAFGNSSLVSEIPFDDGDPEREEEIVAADARWNTHYDVRDAPLGHAWGSDSAPVEGLVTRYRDSELTVEYNEVLVPGNDYVQIALFWSWPVSSMISPDIGGGVYENGQGLPAQPFIYADETVSQISSMQSEPTEDMFRFINDSSKVLNWSLAPAPVPYLGPVVTNDPQTAQAGSTVTYTGSDLDDVTSATIAGVSSTIVSKSPSAITLRVPTGLSLGMHDVDLYYGTTEVLTLQNGLIIENPIKVWTQLQTDNTVKMYAKNIIGEGKIQFFHNGKEIAWINAIDELDPKLSSANGFSYLVRTRELVAGQKNAFEIYQDGKRIWRAAYAG